MEEQHAAAALAYVRNNDQGELDLNLEPKLAPDGFTFREPEMTGQHHIHKEENQKVEESVEPGVPSLWDDSDSDEVTDRNEV